MYRGKIVPMNYLVIAKQKSKIFEDDKKEQATGHDNMKLELYRVLGESKICHYKKNIPEYNR